MVMAKKHLMFTEAPFDWMYGFRGKEHNVDVLSPYEMLLHWAVTRINPPGGASKETRAQWTAEGRDYLKECKLEGVRPECVPGVHYTALEDPHRILVPDLPGLRGLRHCWCWENLKRLHLSTWSYAKLPCARFSHEENARLLCVYMRPWTLQQADASKDNPLLSQLGQCERRSGQEVPVFLSAHVGDASWQTLGTGQSQVRKRVNGKQAEKGRQTENVKYYSYARSW